MKCGRLPVCALVGAGAPRRQQRTVKALTSSAREQGDALFCMALLHDNLDNREQANALYIKCSRV
jgi:hypothetical protein